MATTGRVAAARSGAPWRTRARVIGDSPPIRYLMAHPDLAAALLLALLVLVYLWPVLIGGKLLSPNAILYSFAPWQSYAPSDIANYSNPLLADIPTADYPWRWFARESLHDGTLPLWNPHVFGGIPFLSNPQTGLFSPFNLPLWTLPLDYALGLSAAIKLWFAGFGTYLVARQLSLGFLPGLLGGAAFTFCAFNITWLAHETLPGVAVMLPWVVWLLELLFARGRLSTALWLGVVTAVGLGGGHPGMQVHLVAIAALYASVRVWLVPGLSREQRLRRLALAAGGLLLGLLLMAVMLLPEALSSRGTIGTQSRAGGRGTLPGTVMPFDAIRTTIFPDWWGRPSGEIVESGSTSAGGVVNFNERTFYGGVVALLFALVALVSRGSWRAKAPFLLLAFVGLAAPLHLPGLWTFLTHVPPFDLVQNQRLHFAYAFAIAVLAAFGLRALIERPSEERWRLIVPGAAVLLGVVALASIGAGGSDLADLWEHFRSGTSFAIAEVLALTSTSWFLLFALGVGVALLAAIRWPRWRYAIAVAVVVLTAADGLHFATGYQPMGPADKLIPPRTPAIAYLQQHASDGRVMGLANALPNDWSITYGLSDVRGYDPPYPTRRMYDLWLAANPEQVDWSWFGMERMDATALQVVSVLGARYVVTNPGVTDQATRADPVLSALSPAYQGTDATIFANARAVPRVRIAQEIAVAPDAAATVALITDPAFVPKTTVVVEQDEREAAALAGGPAPTGTVTIADERNARMTLDATLDRRGLVVLNDSLTDGWTVTVDGEPAEAVRVNNLMRGVVASPGRHEIVWSYAMPGLRLGALLSLLALLTLAGGAVVLSVRKRRGS